jgi:hypothetical protein
MARRTTDRLWLAVLIVAAGMGFTVVAATSPSEDRAARHEGAVAVAPSPADAAVVPARTQARAGAGAQPYSGRSSLPLVAAVVAVACLYVGAAAGRVPPAAPARGRLACRHATAGRAPPAPRFA